MKRYRRSFPLLVVVALIFAHCAVAGATPATFDFTADINGAPITGSFTWNTSNAPLFSTIAGVYAYYPDAVLSVSIGGETLDTADIPDSVVVVFRNYSGITGYRLQVDNGLTGSSDINVDVQLYSSNPGILSSYDLTSTIPPVSDYTIHAFGLFIFDSLDDFVGFDSIQPAASIPEANTLVLFGTGLWGVFVACRRRNMRSSAFA